MGHSPVLNGLRPKGWGPRSKTNNSSLFFILFCLILSLSICCCYHYFISFWRFFFSSQRSTWCFSVLFWRICIKNCHLSIQIYLQSKIPGKIYHKAWNVDSNNASKFFFMTNCEIENLYNVRRAFGSKCRNSCSGEQCWGLCMHEVGKNWGRGELVRNYQ